jgi:hypothetical protein
MEKFYIRANNELECHQIMLKDWIINDEWNEDTIVADIYDMKDFDSFNQTLQTWTQ